MYIIISIFYLKFNLKNSDILNDLLFNELYLINYIIKKIQIIINRYNTPPIINKNV
jgi:hypothetical protein